MKRILIRYARKEDFHYHINQIYRRGDELITPMTWIQMLTWENICRIEHVDHHGWLDIHALVILSQVSPENVTTQKVSLLISRKQNRSNKKLLWDGKQNTHPSLVAPEHVPAGLLWESKRNIYCSIKHDDSYKDNISIFC